jgi:16S rRNA (adenine1518-N6/adenine1519-N6)-dimethyltransferase
MKETKLGQHFLINTAIAKKEIKQANIQSDDIVLEIGPGKGILTNLIAEKAKQVVAIEIDKKLFISLKKAVSENVYLINADALKYDFNDLPRFTKIVSNLPYQISSPITFKFLKYDFKKAVLVYQKEFADRMFAKPGEKDYSRLSVGIYYKAFCNHIQNIHPNCFSPPPLVESSMVELIPRKEAPFKVKDEKFFFELTKQLFNHRRKKINTTIKNIYHIYDENIPNSNFRVETLTPQQIGEISTYLYEILQS